MHACVVQVRPVGQLSACACWQPHAQASDDVYGPFVIYRNQDRFVLPGLFLLQIVAIPRGGGDAWPQLRGFWPQQTVAATSIQHLPGMQLCRSIIPIPVVKWREFPL